MCCVLCTLHRENGLVPLQIDFYFSQYEKNEMTGANETNIELIAEMYDLSLTFFRINIFECIFDVGWGRIENKLVFGCTEYTDKHQRWQKN